MKAKIDFVGQQSIFSNEDELPVEVVIKRCFDEPYFSKLISSVHLKLVCEGNFIIDETTKTVSFYESAPVPARCSYTTRGHVLYSGQVQFPSADLDLPCSLTYDGRKPNSIRWLVRAVIRGEDGSPEEVVERSCMFRASGQLPSLLNLVDVEHSETVDNSKITLITTHAAAGLPQVPLAAGISFNVDCQTPGKFSITRLRVLLHELNEVKLDEKRQLLPLRRWLLEDFRPRNGGIALNRMTTCLADAIGDVHIDQPTLAPSFETEYLFHGYDLVVEITLSWIGADGKSVLMKKLVSVSPVRILPRVNGTQYKAMSPVEKEGAETVPSAALFDPAEITDTSDDDAGEPRFLSSVSSDNSSIFTDRFKQDSDDFEFHRVMPTIVTSAPS